MATDQSNDHIRYEPDEPCPFFVSATAGFQGVLLVLTPIVTTVTTTAHVAEQSEQYLIWAAFAALLICGLTTALQAGRVWRVGSGHVLITAASVSLIVVGVPALEAGGPAMLASLVIAGAIAQFVLSAWLPLLRRVITPVVAGTALLLLAATVIPIAAGRVTAVATNALPVSGPVVATVTLIVVVALGLRVSGVWRLWVPLVGIVAGCVAAVPFGLYDFQLVAKAPWVGVPGTWFPDFSVPDAHGFLTLLPMVVIVVFINGIKNMGDSVVVQRLSRRNPKATDFRLVQRSLNANGVGVLLSGIAGSPPTTINSATSGSLVSLTGVANRNVGYAAGAMLAVLAFSPKLTAVLLMIPAPVMGAYLLVLMGTYVVEGIRTVSQDDLDHKKTLIMGLSFSLGMGLETSAIIGDLPGAAWIKFLDNGLTAGAIAAVLMTWFAELTGPRPKRMETELNDSALTEIDAFLREISASKGWDDSSTDRLCAAGEETLFSLLSDNGADEPAGPRRLTIVARPGTGVLELEFFTALEGQNLQDRLAYLTEEESQEQEASFRLLSHYARSVRQQKYYGMDVVKVLVAERSIGASRLE